jgi:hypothetical protein
MNYSISTRFGSSSLRYLISLSAIILAFTFFAASISAQTSATVYIDVIKSGAPQPVDTIFANGHYEFRIWSQLNFVAGGMKFPFRISSPDGLTLNWLAVPDGYGEGSLDPGAGCACLTFAPGGNVQPSTLDMTGFIINEFDMNGQLDDTIMMGGVSLGGIPSCDLEHWFSLHFSPGPLAPHDLRTLCIDSVFEALPASIRLAFIDAFGAELIPLFEGPFCWPVTYCCNTAGDANEDGSFGIGDAVYLVAWIFKGSPGPICYDEGNVNGDDWIDVGDVVYMINYIFYGGPPLTCP